MENIIVVAVATDDGINYIDRHFGDAKYHDIYEISSSLIKLKKRISFDIEENDDDGHGDPKKAKGVSSILIKEGVTVALAAFFGPNIKRIKKKFVCVIKRDKDIDSGLELLQNNLLELLSEYDKGESRNIIKY